MPLPLPPSWPDGRLSRLACARKHDVGVESRSLFLFIPLRRKKSSCRRVYPFSAHGNLSGVRRVPQEGEKRGAAVPAAVCCTDSREGIPSLGARELPSLMRPRKSDFAVHRFSSPRRTWKAVLNKVYNISRRYFSCEFFLFLSGTLVLVLLEKVFCCCCHCGCHCCILLTTESASVSVRCACVYVCICVDFAVAC